MVGADNPFYLKFWAKLTTNRRSFENADFQSIFDRSSSAVTPFDKQFNYHQQKVH